MYGFFFLELAHHQGQRRKRLKHILYGNRALISRASIPTRMNLSHTTTSRGKKSQTNNY